MKDGLGGDCLTKPKVMPQKVFTMLPCKWIVVAVLASGFGMLNFSPAVAQTDLDIPAQVRRQIRDIDKTILTAGRLFQKGDYAQSAGLISAAQKAMGELLQSPHPTTIQAADLTYRKLAKAHQLLTSKGESLAALMPLGDAALGKTALGEPALGPPVDPPVDPPVAVIPPKSSTPEAMAAKGSRTSPAKTQSAKVSFVGQVAPVLLEKCGNCHVSDRRGNFSAASFRSLDNSTMITPAMADKSRMIEVIESGEMPPVNPKVTAAELMLLKQWIDQGANFDGKNPGANLSSLNRPTTSVGDGAAIVLTKPTGNEPVSFGLHIAPILLENCAQCHIARNPPANFSVADFAALMRGGDSGQKPLSIRQGATSEIVLRMKGEQRDVMPPSGKLDDRLIALVEQWIDQGAAFDPADVRLPLSAVASKGMANSMDHDQLANHRNEAAQQTWRFALAGITPVTATTENFSVIGTGAQGRLQEIGTVAEDIAQRVARLLGVKPQAPFVKGDTTLFVVDKRYDFSEFGRMIEKRSFDKTVISSWQSDTVLARVLLLSGLKDQAADYQVSLARDIASVQVANLHPSVPRWFADGMGYWAAAKLFGRDPVVEQWKTDATSAAKKMQQANDFISGEMATDQAALASYRFVDALQRNGRAMKKLLNRVGQGVAFESAFADAYGATPEKLLQHPW